MGGVIDPSDLEQFEQLKARFDQARSRYRFAQIQQTNSDSALVITGEELAAAREALCAWLNKQVGDRIA